MMHNRENWMCGVCTREIFPFNNIEDEDVFHKATQMSSRNELIVSNLIYNPLELNSFDFSFCSEFDPDVNFFCQQNLFSGYSCNYYLEDSFNDRLKSLCFSQEQVFSICHLNIRSMKSNLSNFENYLQLLQNEFTVIGITETWLNNTTCQLYKMDNYNMIDNHRDDKMGGGVAIFLKNDIAYKQRTDLIVFNDCCESTFVEVNKSVFGFKKNVNFGVLYRPPNTDIHCFTDVLKDICEKIRYENKPCYLMGDYNINLLNVESHSPTADFNDTMFSYGFIPLITRPTRVTQSSATLIDNIFTNQLVDLHNESMQGILITDISDHYPIFHMSKSVKKREAEVKISRRNYNVKNKEKFLQLMSAVDWSDIFAAVDTQSAFSVFHNKLIKIHDMCFPIESISKKYNTRKPWLSQSLRDSIKKKNKLYIKSKKYHCLCNENIYKSYRNELKKLIRAAEKIYHCDLISKYRNDSKKMWSVIKNVINKNKRIQYQDEFKLNDGSLTTDMKLVCNKFNDFYINVGPSLSEKIPKQDILPVNFMKYKAIYSLYLEPVTEIEVKKLISSLKLATPGYDMISSSVLKLDPRVNFWTTLLYM